MGATTKETYDEIVQELQSKEEFDELLPNNDNSGKLLEDVTSSASVDPWRSISWITASVITAFKTAFSLFKKETAQEARNNRIGTIDWWLAMAYEFQYGDSLVLVNGKPGYATIDEEKRVVTKASHQLVTSTNLIKVVKGSFPDFVPLSQFEADSLRSYFSRIHPPGINFAVISKVAEEISIEGDLFFKGTADKDTLKAAVEAKIIDYIIYMPVDGVNEVLNGTFVRNNLIQAVKQVADVKDFVPTKIEVTVDGNTFEVDRTYQPTSGYLRIKTGESLANTIQYYASNV